MATRVLVSLVVEVPDDADEFIEVHNLAKAVFRSQTSMAVRDEIQSNLESVGLIVEAISAVAIPGKE